MTTHSPTGDPAAPDATTGATTDPTTDPTTGATTDPAVELAAEVIDQSLRLAGHLHRELAVALDRVGLNESRLTVLRVVGSRGRDGCSQVELAAALQQAESSVCTLVERMRSDRLILRMRSKIDRRKSFLVLTDDGAARLAAAETAVRDTAGRLGDLWGVATLEPLRAMLEGVLFELERPRPAASETANETKNEKKNEKKNETKRAA